MKEKPEKSSSGLINNSGLAKNIKSENRGRLFLTLNYFLLYQAILFIHFFLTESECKPKILFTQPSLIDEQTIQWTLKMALAVSIAVVKEFIFMEKISSTVLSLTF